MGQAKIRKAKGMYFGQPGYFVPQVPDDYSFPCLCGSQRAFEECCGSGLYIIYEKDSGLNHRRLHTKNFVYTNGELQTIQFDSEFLPAQWSHPCDNCGGVCEWMNVPDKVWLRLGLRKEFWCVRCMVRLIDPSASGTIESLAQAILARKKEFNLQNTNEFFGMGLPDNYALMQMFSVDLPPLTKRQFFDDSWTPRKKVVVHPVPFADDEVFRSRGIYPVARVQRRQLTLLPPMNSWPLHEYAISNRFWIIETQIKDQFEHYCKQQNLRIEKEAVAVLAEAA